MVKGKFSKYYGHGFTLSVAHVFTYARKTKNVLKFVFKIALWTGFRTEKTFNFPSITGQNNAVKVFTVNSNTVSETCKELLNGIFLEVV